MVGKLIQIVVFILFLTVNKQLSAQVVYTYPSSLNEINGKIETPQLEEILSFLNQSIYNVSYNCFYEIAKKPDGYYLVCMDLQNNVYGDKKYYKVWNAKTGKFKIPELKEPKDEYYSNFNEEAFNPSDFRQMFYDFSYFYGYTAWIEDLEKYLAKKPQLSNQEAEMLAEAYYEKARNQIYPDPNGTNSTSEKNDHAPLYEKIDSLRLNNFIHYATKSMNYWEQIRSTDSTYSPLITDDLNLKIANSWMDYYINLISIKEDELANKILNNVSYRECYLNDSREILSACPENSIIITYADSDFYPLVFLQEREGVRKDVIVLNSTLLNFPWYVKMNCERHHLNSTIHTTDLQKCEQALVMIDKDLPAVNSEEWFAVLLLELDKNSLLKQDEESIINDGMISMPSRLIFNSNSAPLEITIRRSFLYISDLALIDLIHSNPDKKFCAMTREVCENFGILNDCSKRGPVYEVKINYESQSAPYDDLNYYHRKLDAMDTSEIRKTKKYGIRQIHKLFDELEIALNNFEPKSQEMYQQFVHVLPFEFLITLNDPQIVFDFLEVSEKIDVEQSSTYRERYLKNILSSINEIEPTRQTIQKEVDQISIFTKIIIRSESLEIYDPNFKFSPVEKEALLELNKRISQLMETSYSSNMSWTRKKIIELDLLLTNLNYSNIDEE